MSEGLIDYLDGESGSRVFVVVAPGDINTGYSSPKIMLTTDETRSLGVRGSGYRVQGRGPSGARTGARIGVTAYAYPVEEHNVLAAGPPGRGYGTASVSAPAAGGEVAAARLRRLYSGVPRLSILRRVFATVLLMTGINRKNISAMLTANAMPPISIMIMRPFIHFTNVGIWIGKAGASTSVMFYGQETTKGGWDGSRIVYTVDFRYHCIPVVVRPENMMVVRNLVTVGRANNFGMDMCEDPGQVANAEHSIVAKLCSYYDTFKDACAENEYSPIPILISAAGDYGDIPGWEREKGLMRKSFRLPHLSCDAYYAVAHREYYDMAPRTSPLIPGLQISNPRSHLCYQGEEYIPDSPTTCNTVRYNAGQLGLYGSLPGSADVRAGGQMYYATAWTPRVGLTP